MVNGPLPLVLVAEDSFDDRFFLERSLRTVNPAYRAVTFSDGRDLLAYLENHPEVLSNCVVFTDYRMPRMNGLETVTRIRANPQWSHLKVVVLSGSDDPVEMKGLFELGVHDYLPKPPTPASLARVLQAGVVARAEPARTSASTTS